MEEGFKNKHRSVKKFKDIDFDSKNIYELSRLNVKNMSTRQLRKFISRATDIAEEAFGGTNEQLSKSLNIITDKTGVRFRDGRKKIVKGYSTMTKSELQERARLLQGHLGIDVFTSRAEREYKDLDEEMMKKISKGLAIEISEEEYSGLWNLIHEVTNLFKAFDSTDVASLYEDARDNEKSGGDVLMAVVQFMQEHGNMDHKNAMDMLGKILRDEL